MMKTYLIHYESATGAHLWASVECGGKLPRSDTLTWFAVYEIPAQISLAVSVFGDPVQRLAAMARRGHLARIAA